MDWVETFYERQASWMGLASPEITDHHRNEAAKVARLGGSGRKRILDLGAGGGQIAATLADLGYDVVAIEIVSKLATTARLLSDRVTAGRLRVIHGDFYSVDLNERFDLVCYVGGTFGIGLDRDQRRLLRRVREWLTPGGCALIDVLAPWYWSATAGQEMRFGHVRRRYDFDAEGCRMLDRWWATDAESEAVTQSLRCYSPADLHLLLEGTDLALTHIEPGGAMNYETMQYTEPVPLPGAMSYIGKLVPRSSDTAASAVDPYNHCEGSSKCIPPESAGEAAPQG